MPTYLQRQCTLCGNLRLTTLLLSLPNDVFVMSLREKKVVYLKIGQKWIRAGIGVAKFIQFY
jgi:hypothetical protein